MAEHPTPEPRRQQRAELLDPGAHVFADVDDIARACPRRAMDAAQARARELALGNEDHVLNAHAQREEARQFAHEGSVGAGPPGAGANPSQVLRRVVAALVTDQPAYALLEHRARLGGKFGEFIRRPRRR